MVLTSIKPVIGDGWAFLMRMRRYWIEIQVETCNICGNIPDRGMYVLITRVGEPRLACCPRCCFGICWLTTYEELGL